MFIYIIAVLLLPFARLFGVLLYSYFELRETCFYSSATSYSLLWRAGEMRKAGTSLFFLFPRTR